MTTYSGFTVIEWQPDWQSNASLRAISKPKRRLDNQLTTWVDDGTAYPSSVGSRTFRYVIDGRPNITAAKAQMAALKGRLTPFWLPSWMYDLELFQAESSGVDTIRIKFGAYTRFYAQSNTEFSRRHLAFILPGPTFIYRRVTNAVDNGDGTETLTLNTTHGVAIPIGTMVSFLTLGRLASDEIKFQWQNFTLAVLEFGFVEVPREAPIV